ncbi:hypothetical protein L1049_005818 [Liquidambar formosana]|uniref:GCK domain-containing protein n=1 Tax=Liquidambar formosana TaxID=63359 RepID=A0AAP0RG08_LIQFO
MGGLSSTARNPTDTQTADSPANPTIKDDSHTINSASNSANPSDSHKVDMSSSSSKTLESESKFPEIEIPENNHQREASDPSIDPKTIEDQSPEVSDQSKKFSENGEGGEGKEGEEGKGEEEEEGECGFCLFMKGGGCKDSFVAWEKCIEEAEKKKEDIVEKCFEVTGLLKKCMEAHTDYYEPILRAEKAAEEEAVRELEREAALKDSEQNAVSKDSEQNAVSKDSEQNAVSEDSGQNAVSEDSDQNAVSGNSEQNVVPKDSEQNVVLREQNAASSEKHDG